MKKKLSYKALESRIKELEQTISNTRNEKKILHDNDYQARKYLSLTRVLFVALDTKGNITLINESGLEILGYQKEELFGKNWFKTCLPEQFHENVLTVYSQLMTGEIEPVEYYENPILRKDGTQRIIAWHNAILNYGSNNPLDLPLKGNKLFFISVIF